MSQLGFGFDVGQTDGTARTAGARARPRAQGGTQLSLLERARLTRPAAEAPPEPAGTSIPAPASDSAPRAPPPPRRGEGRSAAPRPFGSAATPLRPNAASTVTTAGRATRGLELAERLRAAEAAAPTLQTDRPELALVGTEGTVAPEVQAHERRRRRLLDAATVRAVEHVERGLRARLGPNVLVSITDNTSTMVSYKRRGRALYARVHRMFEHADDEVLDALAAFVSEERRAAPLTQRLDTFIEAHKDRLNEARAEALRVVPLGEFHDLQTIFDALNIRYFEGKVDAQITWTRSARKLRRTSINMGTYSDELKLIRIHPALDQAFVPRFFVEFVVYHEMLHQVHKAPDTGGRRVVHSHAFRRDEQRFAQYREARRWETQHLSRLLKY
jgi:hypothetical protein